jgi:hypothetical protein
MYSVAENWYALWNRETFILRKHLSSSFCWFNEKLGHQDWEELCVFVILPLSLVSSQPCVHSAFCPLSLLSSQPYVLSALCPLSLVSSRPCVLSALCPLSLVSSQPCVLSASCPLSLVSTQPCVLSALCPLSVIGPCRQGGKREMLASRTP